MKSCQDVHHILNETHEKLILIVGVLGSEITTNNKEGDVNVPPALRDDHPQLVLENTNRHVQWAKVQSLKNKMVYAC